MDAPTSAASAARAPFEHERSARSSTTCGAPFITHMHSPVAVQTTLPSVRLLLGSNGWWRRSAKPS